MKATETADANPWGYLSILVTATFLMGSSFPATKILLHEIPPFYLAGWRFLLAAAITFMIALFVHRHERNWMPRAGGSIARGWLIVVLIGLLQTAGMIGLLNLAMQSLPASTAAILLFTNPLWVAFLGIIVLNERLSLSRFLALGLGVVGVTLAIGLRAGGSLFGMAIGICSSVCWASATILTKRSHVSTGLWMMSAWQMLVGALALMGIAALTQERWPVALTVSQWSWFVWLAVPASAGSFGLWFLALKRGGATRTSGFLFLAPLFAVLLSHLVLGEQLGINQVVGGVFVVAGLLFLNRGSFGLSVAKS